MLTAENIYLSELQSKNSEIFRIWRNDPDIFTNFFQYKIIAKENHEIWFQKVISDPNCRYFEIHLKDNNKLIGQCCLTHINWVDRHCDFGIYIGDKSYLCKGYGKESLKLLFNFGFSVLNLLRIHSMVFSNNLKALGLYYKLGFLKEGTLRKYHFYKGEYIDVIMIGLLKDEFKH